MSSATETCGCGAKVTFNDLNGDVVLGKRLSEWRTTHRHEAAAIGESAPPHQPQGNNFATTERNYDSAPHEMNAERKLWHSPDGPYGRGISLKWSPNA